MKPRVIIADDHLLFVEGLWRVVEAECQIVGTCSNGRELVEAALRLRPDIVLLDITMPLLSGMEAARQIKAQAPEIKLIFVTMQVNRSYVREAFELGASGYLSKQAPGNELKAAIQQVLSGRFAFSPSLSQALLGSKTCAGQNPAQLFGDLTPRQREVLQLVAEGRSARQIAEVLSISAKTVEFHKKQLMLELRLRNSAELVRFALEHGWVGS
jgi:DNA-binding NarL/FixJ family response regulator